MTGIIEPAILLPHSESQTEEESQAIDYPIGTISYGSFLLSTSVRSAKVLKPRGFRELVALSTNDSPLHQQHERDDFGVGQGSKILDLALDPESREGELFRYMEGQASQVELKLKELEKTGQEGKAGGCHSRKPSIVSLNDDDFLEVDEDHFKVAEIEFLSVAVEREHYKLVGESLQKLRQDILRLLAHLESECTKLDLLDLMPTSGDTHDEIASKRRIFVSRLDGCLRETTNKMDDIVHRNNLMVDGVRKSKDHLESPVNELIRNSPIGCVIWLHTVLFLVLLGAVTFLYLWAQSSDEWTLYLRLLRSPLLVVLLLYLYGINMKVWALYGVDYATILSHPPMATPTPKYMFKMASILTVLLTLLVVSMIVATPYSAKLPIKIVPLLMWLVLFAFLLNPFDILQRRARLNFCLTCVRILVSPFAFVYFSDFFLADQFNSSTAILLDIEYLICYLTTDSWSDAEVDSRVCTSSGNGIRPIVSLLPAFWRFLQCLRCFYDTSNPKHLVNAGKYFSILPVVVFATFFNRNDVLWITICWYTAAFVHAVYTFLWDITGDWGLLTTRCSVFQRKLAYGHKAVYVLAILLDLVLRFFWSIKLTLAIAGEKPELLFTGMDEPSFMAVLIENNIGCLLVGTE